MAKVIKSVEGLINALRDHNDCGGQYATFLYTKKVECNVFPNEEYCKAKGITLASGKGSKALNEPYRFGLNGVLQSYNSITIHYKQSYDKTLAKVGEERSANGKSYKVEHLGNLPIIGIPSTGNICIEYIKNECPSKPLGYLLDGKKVTDADTIAYIRGYKRASTPRVEAVAYRNLGFANLKEVHLDNEEIVVEIDSIASTDYELIFGKTALRA